MQAIALRIAMHLLDELYSRIRMQYVLQATD